MTALTMATDAGVFTLASVAFPDDLHNHDAITAHYLEELMDSCLNCGDLGVVECPYCVGVGLDADPECSECEGDGEIDCDECEGED